MGGGDRAKNVAVIASGAKDNCGHKLFVNTYVRRLYNNKLMHVLSLLYTYMMTSLP